MSTGVATVPKVSPQTIGGPLNTHNRKAFDWSATGLLCVWLTLTAPSLSLFSCLHRSWQGPVAFGCQNFVVVVEPHTAQRLQTLVHHKAHVTKASPTAIIYIVAAIVVSNTLVTGLLGTAGLSLYASHTLHSAAGIG